MSTIGGSWPTLLDVSTRLDPNGAIAPIVEMLQQDNEILLDAPFIEGNLATGHQVTQRTGLPAVYYRRINQGVPASKSTTAQITETAANLEAFAKIDVRAAELNGGVGSQWMTSETVSFMEAMNQQVAETSFYGSEADTPEEFTGLALRYSSLSAASGENIIDAGGVGSDNTSAWLVTWGERATNFRYPKGGKGGLIYEDLGRQVVRDASNNEFLAYMQNWRWQLGLCVENWQANVRIANIDVSNLVGESSAADLLKLMTKAVHKIPKAVRGRQAFYVNGTAFAMLDIQAQSKSNVYLTIGEEEGRPKVSFRGIPIRRVDQILETEDRVT